jgi:light-independent protochlorophyllide reductase B subunit
MFEQLTFENCSHSRDPVVGCALEGIAGIIAGIRDVSIVIHSPQGCAATVALGYDTHEIDFTKRKVACTRLFESDIIMGAAEKLKDLIKQADTTFQTKVMFVVGTCSADIIGENIEGICRTLQPQINAKLIPVMAGGFRGNVYDGMDLGLKILLPFIKPSSEVTKVERSVNLIAPQASLNPTWWADQQWVTEVLKSMGISVQSVFPRNATLHEIRHASTASANILLSHDVGHTFINKMNNDFGVPPLLADLPLPIGLKNTSRWLTALGEHFGSEDIAQLLIKKGEALVVDVLRRRGLMIIPRYRNCRVAISADTTIGIGLIRMLFEELEMIPELLLFRSDNPGARKLLDEELKSLGISPKVAFGADGHQIKQALKDHKVDAVLGSAWETYLAEELGIKLAFDILSPTNRDVYLDRAYFGYEGMLNILEKVGNDWEIAFRSKEIRWEHYEERQRPSAGIR